MSAYEFARVWGESNTTGSALLVHLALADCAVNGVAKATHENLAALSRLSVASVARAIAHLVEMEEIEILWPKSGSRPAQIAVLPWPSKSQSRQSELKEAKSPPVFRTTPTIGPADHSIIAPHTPLMQKLTAEMLLHGRFQPSLDESGPTEIIDPLLDAIMREPGEPLGGAYSAPAAIQPVEPPRTPPAMLIAPGDVGRVLKAAGVPPNEEMPAYWWRSDHKADLADLCNRLGITVDGCIARITRSGRTMPELRRIGELEPLVRG